MAHQPSNAFETYLNSVVQQERVLCLEANYILIGYGNIIQSVNFTCSLVYFPSFILSFSFASVTFSNRIPMYIVLVCVYVWRFFVSSIRSISQTKTQTNRKLKRNAIHK